MLGRSARNSRSHETSHSADSQVWRRNTSDLRCCGRPNSEKKTTSRPPYRHWPRLPNRSCGGPQQALKSSRSDECGGGCGTMVFAANVIASISFRISGAACGARLRASAARGCGPHGSLSRTTATTKSSAPGRQRGILWWAGCRGRISDASRPRRKVCGPHDSKNHPLKPIVRKLRGRLE